MRRLLFISVMLFLICAQGFTQDTQAPGSPAADRVVAAIEVKGNNSISSNTILSKIKTRIGNDFQESIVNEDLKRLYLLGYFSDIKVDTEPYKEGVKVVFIVVERAIIDKISFKGLQFLRMRDDKIKEELKSKETQYLDYPSLMEDVLTLKKLYEKKGFGQAQVDYKVDTDSGKNTAKIQFNIIEGKKVKIRSIKIQGNKSFASKRILKIMKTKRAWFFNAGILKDDVFREDVERVRVFYRRQGYADAVVNYKTETDPARPFLHITIQIEEGKKYAVGKVTILGNRYIKEDEIRAKLKEAIPGKVFSQEAMKEDISGMQGLYFDRGYISMQVYETTSLNPATNQVEIVYNITENQIAYVDKIKIKGNIKTKDVVIRRELRIRPGDKFDGDKLRRSKERLQNLGFFEEISYDTENTPDNNKKDLVVEVKETKTGAFSFGGGYSTVEQFVGFFEISQKNFDWKNFPYFTGDGQDLTFRAALGSVSENFVLSFTEPWMYDYPVSFGFDLYRRTHDRDTDIGYGYNEDVSGGDIRLGKEISEYVKANFMYRYDSIKISGVDETASDDLKSEEGENIISSTSYELTYDSRDNILDPSKGKVYSGSVEIAGGPFGGDKDFWRFFGMTSYYFPVWRKSVVEAKGRIGLADSYGDSSRVPIYERYFAGGANTVRGYRERKIGPIDSRTNDPMGGDSMLIGNLEYNYPLANFFKLAAFYDVGNVWSEINDLGLSGLKSGVGFGFRLKTPIGPLKLDYGIPLNKESGEDSKGDGRFHFSMSHGF